MLKRVISYIMGQCGYIHRSRYNELGKLNSDLREENKRLRMKNRDLDVLNKAISEEIRLLDEENKSLWDMLDETKSSQSFGKDQVKSMMEDLSDLLTDEMLKDFKPVGEA